MAEGTKLQPKRAFLHFRPLHLRRCEILMKGVIRVIQYCKCKAYGGLVINVQRIQYRGVEDFGGSVLDPAEVVSVGDGQHGWIMLL